MDHETVAAGKNPWKNPKENLKWWETLPFVLPHKDLINVWTSLTKKNAKLHVK